MNPVGDVLGLHVTIEKHCAPDNRKLLPQQSFHDVSTAAADSPIPTNPVARTHTSKSRSCRVPLITLLPWASFAFMLYSSFTAVWQSHGDPSTVFFVASSLSVLGLLYVAMREFERAVAAKEDRKRDLLKIAIWGMATALNVIFSARVSSVLQSPVMSAVVWLVAVITTLIGCRLLFFLPRANGHGRNKDLNQGARCTK